MPSSPPEPASHLQRLAPRATAALCVGLVAALVLVMALRTPYHDSPGWYDPPGERDHLVAAAFYLDHALPPAVDDPAAAPSMILSWGCSYAHYLDIIYPLAGSLARATPDAIPLHLRLRLFNLACLLALTAVVIATTPRNLSLLFFFLVTPQAWYMFSFFNGDALPLCLGFSAAALLIALGRDGWGPRPWLRATTLGALVGLIILCRQYFWIFTAFACAVPVARQASRQWRPILLALCVATAVIVPRWLHDQAINDFNKPAKLEALAERTADPAFRHSNLHEPWSGETMYLREKGVSLLEMQQKFRWAETSFASFFAYYGWMVLRSPPPYYIAVGLLFPACLGILSWYTLRRGERRDRLVWLLSIGASVLTVAQSAYYSWTANAQPQGRYLFALLPILAVGLAPAFNRMPRRLAWGMILAFLALSLWSFGTALTFLLKIFHAQ